MNWQEAGVYDGWSDEEERVFMLEEVAAPGDSDSDSGSEEDPGPRRATQRRRWCLDGCDCERLRGRKCNCELRGDLFCGDRCGCDPQKCRARRINEEDDA